MIPRNDGQPIEIAQGPEDPPEHGQLTDPATVREVAGDHDVIDVGGQQRLSNGDGAALGLDTLADVKVGDVSQGLDCHDPSVGYLRYATGKKGRRSRQTSATPR